LPNLHIIGTAGPHFPVPSPGGVTYGSLNVTSKVFTALKSYGQLAEFATTAVFQKGQFVTFDTVYNEQGVPRYRFIRMQPDGSFVPVDFPLPAFQLSVDSVTQGLVAVMQSDSDYFMAATISDDGHAGTAVN
jgi:hypothetical protein